VRVWLPRYPTVGLLLDRSPRFSDASCRHTQPFACRAALGLPFKWSLLAQALRVLGVSCSLGEPRYLSTALDAHFPPQRRCREAAESGTSEGAHSAPDVGPATLTAAPLLWLQQAEKLRSAEIWRSDSWPNAHHGSKQLVSRLIISSGDSASNSFRANTLRAGKTSDTPRSSNCWRV
jgi:hypothetical protein